MTGRTKNPDIEIEHEVFRNYVNFFTVFTFKMKYNAKLIKITAEKRKRDLELSCVTISGA